MNILEAASHFYYDADNETLVGKHGERYSLVQSGRFKTMQRVPYLGQKWALSRLVWAVVHKEDPGKFLIRHLSEDRYDHRPCNLKKLTAIANGRMNQGANAAKANRKEWLEFCALVAESKAGTESD